MTTIYHRNKDLDLEVESTQIKLDFSKEKLLADLDVFAVYTDQNLLQKYKVLEDQSCLICKVFQNVIKMLQSE